MEEPGVQQSTGLRRVRHDLATKQQQDPFLILNETPPLHCSLLQTSVM